MMNTIKTYLNNKTSELMKKDRHNFIFKTDFTKWVVVILCVLFNAWVFYTHFSILMNHGMLVNILMAVVCAAAMVFFPLAVVNNLMEVKKTKENITLIVTFSALFLMMSGLSITLGLLGAIDAELSIPKMLLSVLLVFMPFITGILIFGLSYADAKANQKSPGNSSQNNP